MPAAAGAGAIIPSVGFAWTCRIICLSMFIKDIILAVSAVVISISSMKIRWTLRSENTMPGEDACALQLFAFDHQQALVVLHGQQKGNIVVSELVHFRRVRSKANSSEQSRDGVHGSSYGSNYMAAVICQSVALS